jgi:hypothetical protein
MSESRKWSSPNFFPFLLPHTDTLVTGKFMRIWSSTFADHIRTMTDLKVSSSKKHLFRQLRGAAGQAAVLTNGNQSSSIRNKKAKSTKRILSNTIQIFFCCRAYARVQSDRCTTRLHHSRRPSGEVLSQQSKKPSHTITVSQWPFPARSNSP